METSAHHKWNDNERDQNPEQNISPNPGIHTDRSIPDPEGSDDSGNSQESTAAADGQKIPGENRGMNEGIGNAYGSDPDADDLIHDLDQKEGNASTQGSYDGRDSDPDADEMTDNAENELI